MDFLARLEKVDLVTLLAIATIVVIGLRWLRREIRAEFQGKAFREAVRAESIEAFKDKAGKEVITEIVSSAVVAITEEQNKAIQDLDRRVADHGRRLGDLERWRAAVEAKFNEEIARLQRLLVKLFKAMVKAGLIKDEENGS